MDEHRFDALASRGATTAVDWEQRIDSIRLLERELSPA